MVMINLKRFSLIMLIFTLFLNVSYKANAWTEVNSVKAIDNKTINVLLNEQNGLVDWEIAWELKLLNDVQVLSVEKDTVDTKKVSVYLWENKLLPNKSYSLLTVFGSEWSIDFKTKSTLENIEILNTWLVEWQRMDHIFIKDSNTIEIYYTNPLSSTDFEYKLLSSVDIDKVTKTSNNLIINTKDLLKDNSSYIIMLISIMDTNSNEVEFADWIYDFTTEIFPKNKVIKTSEKITSNNNKSTIETVSLNVAESPDTWAETNVLIALTFILSGFVFLRKKIFRK